MTTTTISFDGLRPGRAVVSACSEPVGMPRVRRPWQGDAAQVALVAGKSIFYKSTRVSVPGCRGAT